MDCSRAVSVLIVAAGRGRRLGAQVPKQFISVGGWSLLERCLAVFESVTSVDDIWLVLPRAQQQRWKRLGRRFRKLRGAVAGGRERCDSVARGLDRVDHDGVVLVHDAARPFVSREIICCVIEATRRYGAAVPAMPVGDTLKREGRAGRVGGTVPRDRLWAAQTPQGFRVPLLRRAYSGRKPARVPDDSALVERLGVRIKLVRGSPLNFKVTWKEDLRLARALAVSIVT
ncbi:MAG: 2-C-methyl-D-erythritol 4-phosphate cytidylyltransferase [Acidobacteria bacterium]|nr:2-C-methyl-D-erythritol 4-phosphate cytidylyltransferase [Acidobacteriota bacterium]